MFPNSYTKELSLLWHRQTAFPFSVSHRMGVSYKEQNPYVYGVSNCELHIYIYIYIYIYIQGVSGGIVNVLGGGSMDYSE